MPSPTDTLLRVQLSPVPAHITFGFVGSIATAPIDCTACVSNTGLNVVPLSTDFQTPPLADPTITVSRPLSSNAVTAATRPLISAEPMLRMGRPEIVPASKRAGRVADAPACCAAPTGTIKNTEAAQAARPAKTVEIRNSEFRTRNAYERSRAFLILNSI